MTGGQRDDNMRWKWPTIVGSEMEGTMYKDRDSPRTLGQPQLMAGKETESSAL